MKLSTKILGSALITSFVLTVFIWDAALSADHRGTLTVSFLSVGQGDATFIIAPSGRKVLVDGGPDTSALRALASSMQWWDRSIDVVVSTSPGKGGSTGLVDILGRFRVARIVRSDVRGTDSYSRTLSDAIDAAQARGASVIIGKRGQILDIGGGAYLEILSPDRVVPGVSAAEGCVVMRLVYGTTSFMLPCDAPSALQNYLAYLDGSKLHSDVLKVGKGGMNGSLSELFAGYVSPAYAVYSRSCGNAPGQSTQDTLARFGVDPKDTCGGTITFVSDGETVRVR